MSKATWQRIKKSKNFYVRTYRKLGSILLGSAIFNVILGIVVSYVYFSRPIPEFYATYGETPPVKLFAMDTPNYSSTPLLSDDRKYESSSREIPN